MWASVDRNREVVNSAKWIAKLQDSEQQNDPINRQVGWSNQTKKQLVVKFERFSAENPARFEQI